MKVMCDENKQELNQEVDIQEPEEQECYSDSEEVMGQIAVQEELKRIDIQDDPISETSEATKNSKFYKESMEIIETIGESFQKLLGYGVDYNNALAISSALMTNDSNIKIAKVQQAIQEQNQV